MIQGQVVHKRTPGKNLVFLDIIEDVEGERRRTSVLFKDQSLLEQVKRGDKKVHLGDSLSVEGSFDGSIFLARNFTLIEAWKDKFPGKTFQAIPPNCSSKQSQVESIHSFIFGKFILCLTGSGSFIHDSFLTLSVVTLSRYKIEFSKA